MSDTSTPVNHAKERQTQRAFRAALASLLNLTFMPVVGFVWLLLIGKSAEPNQLDHYHYQLGIKINLIAAFCLLLVTALMIIAGGLNSAYTWIYVINYFTLVHTVFILIATWAMVRAWLGQKLKG